MKERTSRVLVFFSCTTVPTTALSSAAVTAPDTLRICSSIFFWFLVCALIKTVATTRTSQSLFISANPLRVLPLHLQRDHPLPRRPPLFPRRTPAPGDPCSKPSSPRRIHRN